MYDVELILRFFTMRHIEEFNGKLSEFMDACLRQGNHYSSEALNILKETFEDTIAKAEKLFSDKAFCQYTMVRNKMTWTAPQKMIYDPIMLALSQISISTTDKMDIDINIQKLKEFYELNKDMFDGKRQSKKDIQKRVEIFISFIKELIEEYNE